MPEDNNQFHTLDEIEDVAVERISTGIENLDELYGYEIFPIDDENDFVDAGMPRGAISIWGGTAGAGKSRTASEVCIFLTSIGFKVAYFQLETNLANMKQWLKAKIDNPKHFLLSTEKDFTKQVPMLRSLDEVDLVIIDSVNKLEGCKNEKEIDLFFNLYQELISEKRCHLLLIGQLDKAAKSVAGSRSWTYMPDSVFFFTKYKPKKQNAESSFKTVLDTPKSGDFEISVPEKNRYGESGHKSVFRHNSDSVELVQTTIDI